MDKFEFNREITAIELVNSIVNNHLMNIRKSFEYSIRIRFNEGSNFGYLQYAKVENIKNNGKYAIIECVRTSDQDHGGITINEFKHRFLESKIKENQPILFAIYDDMTNSSSQAQKVGTISLNNSNKYLKITIIDKF